MKGDDPDMVKRMIDFIYNLDYELGPFESRSQLYLAFRDVFGHTDMYALADRYDIATLRAAAAVKFSNTLAALIAKKDYQVFPLAVRLCYKKTANSKDNEMRKAVLDKAVEIAWKFAEERSPFSNLKWDMPEFGNDLFNRLCNATKDNPGSRQGDNATREGSVVFPAGV